MEHDSSFNKRLRKETTVRAKMNKKMRKLEADIDKNYENIDEISRGTNKIKKTIRRGGHKDRKHREL